MNNHRRLEGLFLALALTIGLFPQPVLAQENTEGTDIVNVIDETDAEVMESANIAEQTAVRQTQTVTEETPSETDSTAAETGGSSTAEAAEEPVSDMQTDSAPALSLQTQADDGTEIYINAPEGAFPEGIQVSVTKVDAEKILTALQQASENSDLTADQVAAYDFDFYLEDGEHNIEPAQDISVRISLPELAENNAVSAYHLQDENAAAEKEDVSIDTASATASLQSGRFSIHALLLSQVPDTVTIDYDPNTTIHSVTQSDGTKIILYCMNNDLHWPHATESIKNVPTYTETTFEDFFAANNITGDAQTALKTKLESLLYAGYPYNGYGLYEIVPSVVKISEDDFNQLLTPPRYLRDDFPDSIGNNTFTYADRNDSNKKALLQKFLQEVSSYWNAGTTSSGLTYQQLIQLSFYKAALCIVNFSDDPIESYSSIYLADYYVSKEQAYGSTRDAVWSVLKDADLTNNSQTVNTNALTEKLINSANSSSTDMIPASKPDANEISVSGNQIFYYNAADQKWHTGRLTLNAPSTYHTAFTLSLPAGITEETGKTQVRPGESFSLVSSAKPSDQVSVKLSSSIPWMDPNLKVYAADRRVTASDGRGFQNMIGAVIHQEDISITVTLSTSTADFTFTKVWNDENNQNGIRPDTEKFIESLTLMDGDTVLRGYTPEVVDNGDNTYTVTYADLPKYIDGKEISYSVMEKEIQGYVQSDSVVKNGGTLVNTEVKEPLPDRNSDEKTPTDTEVTLPLPDGSDNQAVPTDTEERKSLPNHSDNVPAEADHKAALPAVLSQKQSAPETGVDSHALQYGVLSVCALAVLAVLRMLKKRKSSEA